MFIDTMSIAQFISENRIVSASYRTDSNPNMPDSGNMDHWKVTLVRAEGTGVEGRYTHRKFRLTVHFSKGHGHHGSEPETAEVLSCLADDSRIADDHSFEDFCSELGSAPDSREAERTYKACQHNAKRLLNFLGSDLYGQLLYSTERS
jgi:hypothetical protein